jgi:hypothetical protein
MCAVVFGFEPPTEITGMTSVEEVGQAVAGHRQRAAGGRRAGRPAIRFPATLVAALAIAAIGGPRVSPAQDRFDRSAATDRPTTVGFGPEAWSRYVEPRFGTSVSYPAGVFSQEGGAPPEGTGEGFRTPDGRARLFVYSLPNDDRATPRSYVDRHLVADKRSLDYSRVTDRFFAISGVHDGQVFYSRCNFAQRADPRIHCVYLYYPERETRGWDAIVTRISRSLDGRPGSR